MYGMLSKHFFPIVVDISSVFFKNQCGSLIKALTSAAHSTNPESGDGLSCLGALDAVGEINKKATKITR